jgi:hypothetical protein
MRNNVCATRAQMLADMLGDLGEARKSADRLRAGPLERHLDGLDDPTGSRREDQNFLGEQHGLGDAVRDEYHRRVDARPEPQQFVLHNFPRNLIKRCKGLVHQQDLRLEYEGARNRYALPKSLKG